ncbi:MAG: Rrf2 family transcriptional regulator [Acidimicrobiales bacterium]|nr:Rrf2 family transcriptional regulator [Acidimicrobiales bacterium]
MRVTAKVDYAVRAAVELARAVPEDGSRPRPLKGQQVATAQGIPPKFLENILADLKRSAIVGSMRGAEGGYWLTRTPDQVSIADIIRAVEGPLADVRGVRPEALDYGDDLIVLQRTWIAVRANLRGVLEHVTLADLVAGALDPAIDALASDADSWSTR